nr:unnamed protein product [Naegleria fowleri]
MRWVILRGMQKPYSGVKLSVLKNNAFSSSSPWRWFGTSSTSGSSSSSSSSSNSSSCSKRNSSSILEWPLNDNTTLQHETFKSSHSSLTSQLVECMAQFMKSWGWIEPLESGGETQQMFSFEKNPSQRFRMNPHLSKPRLIVVGGGMSGYKVAKQLSGDLFEIILIDKEGTMDLVPIYPTLISDKNNIHHISISHKKTLPSNVKCVKGVVILASQVGVIVETLEPQEENFEVFKLDHEHSAESSRRTETSLNTEHARLSGRLNNSPS